MRATLLREAEADANDFATAWRMHYKYGPKDPRFTEMTREEILKDLLTIKCFKEKHSGEKDSSTKDFLANHQDEAMRLLEKVQTISKAVNAEGLFKKPKREPVAPVDLGWLSGED